MKKLYSLLLILTPIKKVHAFQKFMSVLITFVAINYEEMLKKDFASKYFLEINIVVIRTNLQWLIICCRVISWACHVPIKVLKQKNTLERFITTAVAYLEPRQISMMKTFGLTTFTKKSIIDFRLGFKYASVMEENIWK